MGITSETLYLKKKYINRSFQHSIIAFSKKNQTNNERNNWKGVRKKRQSTQIELNVLITVEIFCTPDQIYTYSSDHVYQVGKWVVTRDHVKNTRGCVASNARDIRSTICDYVTNLIKWLKRKRHVNHEELSRLFFSFLQNISYACSCYRVTKNGIK